jgi:hypothetical protein
MAETARETETGTVTIERGRDMWGIVIEVKRSDRPEHLQEGYQEATLYRWEYASSLSGWPKAILVASSSVPGAVRHDDVIAIDWDHWVPKEVIEAIFDEGMLPGAVAVTV